MNQTLKTFLVNLLKYAAIVALLYYLYSPFNHHPNNEQRSTSTFVYQQF